MKHGWEIKKVGEVFDLQMGKTPSRDNSEYWGGSNVWVAISDLQDKYIGNSKEYITDRALEETNIRKVKANTVIMSFKLTVGRAAIATQDLYTNEAIMAFNLKEGFDLLPNYIYYYLKGYKWEGANKAVMGLTLNKATISQNYISLPPISEQEHIVQELDLLSGVIEKKRQQLKELDNLAQSIFYDMFGDPVGNDKGWNIVKFADGCVEIGDGLHGTPNYDVEGTIPFINGTNLIDGRIIVTDRTLFVNETEAMKYRVKMDTNTVLLSINGTLGKTAIYQDENVILGKSACFCRLKKEYFNVVFVERLMNTDYFKKFLEENSSKSTIKNVGLKTIRNYKIVVPSLFLQQEFAEKIEAIEKQKELVKQSLAETETLFNSRMEYYFN